MGATLFFKDLTRVEQIEERDRLRDRLAAAVRLRRDVLGRLGPGQACRLVFSEADGLSGCTVDRYDRWLVLQFTSLALAQRRDLLADLLTELIGPPIQSPGDFNGDQRVDAADFTVWRDSIGQLVPAGLYADGNNNGSIDFGDYNVWKNNFGQGAGNGSASSAAVPEPAALTLFALSIVFAAMARQRRPLVF